MFNISGDIITQTPKAIRVGINVCLWGTGGMVENAIILWIPKSQIRDFTREPEVGPNAYSCDLPMWLANKNGLTSNPMGVAGLVSTQ